MLSKLPGVNSHKKSVRIFSRIYYSFLFLIFVMLMFRSREGLCMQDKLVSMLEMFLFFLAFAIPVPVIYFMDKKGFGRAEMLIAVSIAIMLMLTASVYAENLYTEEYKTQLYSDMSEMQSQ